MTDMDHDAIQLALIDAFIKSTEKRMENILEDIPCARIVCSIKGIGAVTVAGLIGEMGDFGTFSTQGEVMKFAGLNIYPHLFK